MLRFMINFVILFTGCSLTFLLGLWLMGLVAFSFSSFAGGLLVLLTVSCLLQVQILGHTKYLVKQATRIMTIQNRGRR